MRHGGLIVVSIAVTIACGAAGAEGGPSHAASGEIGPPPGGNSNHAPTADELAEARAAVPDAGTTAPADDEIMVSGRGFAPPVIVRTGVAGSSDATTARSGSSFDPYCVGTFPSHPQHMVKLGGRLDSLRIVVDSMGNDLTLAVRTPDGAWHCNDDSGDPAYSLNPTVELSSPPIGEIEVWVGTYSSYSTGAPYTLGVTEQPGYASDLLRH